MTLQIAIIKRIQEIAKEKQIPLGTWSMSAGITPSTIYGIINGRAGCPRLQTLKPLCDAIGMKLSEFFDCEYIDNAEQENRLIDLKSK